MEKGVGRNMSAQDFLVSASAAGLAHLIHHPLYTLKSQMMFYGPKFSFIDFVNKAAHQPRGFLYRGGQEKIGFHRNANDLSRYACTYALFTA